MTPDQLTDVTTELARALDKRTPDCMCQVSPRIVAVALAHFQKSQRSNGELAALADRWENEADFGGYMTGIAKIDDATNNRASAKRECAEELRALAVSRPDAHSNPGNVGTSGGYAKEGWVCVPREPTPAMVAATVDTVFDGALEDASVIGEVYAAMLDAAWKGSSA